MAPPLAVVAAFPPLIYRVQAPHAHEKADDAEHSGARASGRSSASSVPAATVIGRSVVAARLGVGGSAPRAVAGSDD